MTDTSPSVHIRVLGDIAIFRGSTEVVITRPGYRHLLCWLAMAGSRSVTSDELIDRLWSQDVPSTAKNTLQQYVSGLRKALGSEIVRTTAHGYQLDVDLVDVDAAEFDALAILAQRSSRDGHADRAVSTAESALNLWHGEPYADLLSCEHAIPETRRLLRSRRQVEELRLASLIDLGKPGDALPLLDALVVKDPLRERLWELMMLAQYNMGDQAEALRTFQLARRILGEEVGLEPGPDLVLLEQQILLQDAGLSDIVTPRRTNLPPQEIELIGRATDLGALKQLIESSHIVTLTGSPGIGKTQTAIETARLLINDFDDGVWFVSLRSESSMRGVVRAFAAGVELDPGMELDALATQLRHMDALILVDNAEHVPDECRRVIADSLKGASTLRFVVTSRAPLGISAEMIWRLRGLSLESATPETLSPAGTLLARRLQMAEPTFRITPQSTELLNSLCIHADGIPLAIVLMAAWLPAVGLDEAVGLTGSDAVRGGEQLGSIDDAIDWSYQLLMDADASVLNHLSVFVSSFDLDAAHAVGAPEVPRGSFIGSIARLVEASLLDTIRDWDGSLRYRTQLPIRDHARQRLRDNGLDADAMASHSALYRARSTSFGMESLTQTGLSVASVEQDIGDYRMVMRRSLANDETVVAADIATGLVDYWFARFGASEGRDWLIQARQAGVEQPLAIHLWAEGFLVFLLQDTEQARRMFESSIETAIREGDGLTRSRSLFSLGRTKLFTNDHIQGAREISQAIDLFGDDPSTLRLRTEAHLLLAMRSIRLGATHDPHLDSAAGLLAALDDQSLESSLLRYKSLAAWNSDDYRTSVDHAQQSVGAARSANDEPKLCGALSQLSLALHSMTDHRGAAEAMVEALEILEGGEMHDIAQVLSGSVPLLISAGHDGTAADVLSLLHEQYTALGADGVGSDLFAARAWQAEVGDADAPGRTGSDLVSHAHDIFRQIAAQ